MVLTSSWLRHLIGTPYPEYATTRSRAYDHFEVGDHDYYRGANAFYFCQGDYQITSVLLVLEHLCLALNDFRAVLGLDLPDVVETYKIWYRNYCPGSSN